MLPGGTINERLQWACLTRILVLLLVAIVALGAFLIYTGYLQLPGNLKASTNGLSTPTATTTLATSYETVDSNGLGISEGRYAFDTNRSDGFLKQQAATALAKGERVTAQSLWGQAIDLDSNDPEAFIYKEDQRILDTHLPYITIVVATMLTGGNNAAVSAGRGNLQGAYILQKTYNDGFQLDGKTQVRILIANSGSISQDAQKVAQQIVDAAKQDKTIVGVMDWPFSEQALDAVDILANAHIPMVSPTASSDALTNKSSFFFRVCPPNQVQAVAGADYAVRRLNAKQVVLFVDPNNSYSQNLADGFSAQFTKDGGQIIYTEKYKVGDSSGLPALLQNALTHSPDLIYFSGYADDMGVVLTNLQSSNPNLAILGGDALYQISAYQSSAHANYYRLRFTTFAFPDEWSILGYKSPPFFDTYARTFDPNNTHSSAPYGYSRPDSGVILSYDAMLSLVEASKNVLADGKTSLTPDLLQQSLRALTGNQSIQGISGQIAFGDDGNPVNKALVILSVDTNGYTQLAKNDVLNCFLKDHCS